MLLSPDIHAEARRFLAHHAVRLSESLTELRDQLRDAIAHRVATAVAEAIRVVTRRVLGDEQPRRPDHDRDGPRWGPGRLRTQDEFLGPDEFDGLDFDDPPKASPSSWPTPKKNELLRALAIAAFWFVISRIGGGSLAGPVRDLIRTSGFLDSGARLAAG